MADRHRHIFHINVGTINRDKRHWTIVWCDEQFQTDLWSFDIVYSFSDDDMIVFGFDVIDDAIAAKMMFSDMLPKPIEY